MSPWAQELDLCHRPDGLHGAAGHPGALVSDQPARQPGGRDCRSRSCSPSYRCVEGCRGATGWHECSDEPLVSCPPRSGRSALVALALVSMAHVGSPDTFFTGTAGPYPVRVTVRLPGVIPGLAQIAVRVPGTSAGRGATRDRQGDSVESRTRRRAARRRRAGGAWRSGALLRRSLADGRDLLSRASSRSRARQEQARRPCRWWRSRPRSARCRAGSASCSRVSESSSAPAC